MPEQISIYSDAARKVINEEIAKIIAARPGLSNDQRRGRPVNAAATTGRFMLGQVTAVFNAASGQPKYNARGVEFPLTTVTQQTPFWRIANASTFVTAATVGDECVLFKDSDGTWRLGLAHEFIATDDCQSVAGSRNNMAFLLVTAAAVSLDSTADWIDADATAAPIVLTLEESEVGKRMTIAKVDATANTVTINNTVNGAASLVITAQYDAPTVAYNGTEWRIV